MRQLFFVAFPFFFFRGSPFKHRRETEYKNSCDMCVRKRERERDERRENKTTKKRQRSFFFFFLLFFSTDKNLLLFSSFFFHASSPGLSQSFFRSSRWSSKSLTRSTSPLATACAKSLARSSPPAPLRRRAGEEEEEEEGEEGGGGETRSHPPPPAPLQSLLFLSHRLSTSPASGSALPSEKEASAPLFTRRAQPKLAPLPLPLPPLPPPPLPPTLPLPRATASAAALAAGFSLSSPRSSLAA